MSRLLKFPNPNLEQEQAALWISRLDRGLRDREPEQLRAWLAESGRHREALYRTAWLWDRMEVLGELAEMFPLQEQVQGSRWKGAVQAAAAVAALAIASAALFDIRLRTDRSADAPAAAQTMPAPRAPIATNYATAVGELRTVELPDHSIIQMNTNTALQVEFTANRRMLKMTRGEATFQVTKDPARPMTVNVNGIEVNVVGTVFNIRAEATQNVQLMVTEGRVRVHRTRDQVQTIRLATAPSPADFTVDADHMALIEPSSATIDPIKPEQIAAATAWQQGIVVFDGTPLAAAIAELGRYSNDRLVLADPALGGIEVSGYFKLGNMDAVLAALQDHFGITARRENRQIVLSAAPAK